MRATEAQDLRPVLHRRKKCARSSQKAIGKWVWPLLFACRMSRKVVLAAGFIAAILAACSKARSVDEGRHACVSWKEQLADALKASCEGCHSGTEPSANYDVTTYAGTIRAAQAGDPKSVLLMVLDPTQATVPHRGFDGLLPLLSQWVVDCRLSYFQSAIHSGGIQNPADGDFHGTLLSDLNWNFDSCAACHGADFRGGKSESSCTTCHPKGPTSCQTCHDTPPPSGAHRAHAQGSTLAKAFDCTECHAKPELYSDVGHILHADGTRDDAPAEIAFGAMADGSGAAKWDGARCSGVYCHGGAFDDTRATHTSPTWHDGADQATCGSCHGLPPSNHNMASGRCASCHPRVATNDAALVSTSLHLDGKIDLGDGSESCTACHGGVAGPAPPRDLAGHSTTSAIGVGAHQSHLEARHRLAASSRCADCHVVPTAVASGGHIDSDLPAEVTFSETSVVGETTPTWDRSSATCANTYCHGEATPIWTMTGTGQAACGTCHGVPPSDDVHAPTLTIAECQSCHEGTVDGFGNILINGAPSAETSKHINGVVDAP